MGNAIRGKSRQVTDKVEYDNVIKGNTVFLHIDHPTDVVSILHPLLRHYLRMSHRSDPRESGELLPSATMELLLWMFVQEN